MPKIPLSNGTWVVACDGAKAVVFENTGDWEYPHLELRQEMAQPDPPDREIYTGPKGRVFNRADGAGSTIERDDAHQRAEMQFMKSVAHYLDKAVADGKIKKMVVAAAPRALGVLRAALSKRAHAAIIAEIDRDYVKMPAYEIESVLSKKQ
ncbi:MAG TPA: host attachment family protein [Rhizomicrobium sp.]|nr:host attachment family protein [Rhizomicrobium sp.]